MRVTGDERPRTRADTLEALLAATPDRRGEVDVGAPRVRREVLSVAAKPGDGAPTTRFELALQRADHGAVAVVIDLAEPLELVVERHQSDGSRTWTWEPAVLWAPALGTLGVTDPGRAFARVAEQKRWHDGGWVWNTIVVASAQADRPNLAAADRLDVAERASTSTSHASSDWPSTASTRSSPSTFDRLHPSTSSSTSAWPHGGPRATPKTSASSWRSRARSNSRPDRCGLS